MCCPRSRQHVPLLSGRDLYLPLNNDFSFPALGPPWTQNTIWDTTTISTVQAQPESQLSTYYEENSQLLQEVIENSSSSSRVSLEQVTRFGSKGLVVGRVTHRSSIRHFCKIQEDHKFPVYFHFEIGMLLNLKV